MSTPLQNYLANTPADKINPAMVSYVANLQQVAEVGPEIAASIVKLPSRCKEVPLKTESIMGFFFVLA